MHGLNHRGSIVHNNVGEGARCGRIQVVDPTDPLHRFSDIAIEPIDDSLLGFVHQAFAAILWQLLNCSKLAGITVVIHPHIA